MASYVLKKIHCKCCGNDFEEKILKGFYNNYSADLDGYPHNPAMFDSVVICPNCGYATDRIQAEADTAVIDIVESEEYQEIFSSESLSCEIKKELLNAMLKKATGMFYEAAISYLHIYWKQRESGVYDEEALTNAIQCLSQYLEETMDIGAAITLIDCQRQQGDFIEAEETALSLLSYVQELKYKNLIEFELQLILNNDRLPHSQSEVVV